MAKDSLIIALIVLLALGIATGYIRLPFAVIEGISIPSGYTLISNETINCVRGGTLDNQVVVPISCDADKCIIANYRYYLPPTRTDITPSQLCTNTYPGYIVSPDSGWTMDKGDFWDAEYRGDNYVFGIWLWKYQAPSSVNGTGGSVSGTGGSISGTSGNATISVTNNITTTIFVCSDGSQVSDPNLCKKGGMSVWIIVGIILIAVLGFLVFRKR